MNYEAMWNEFKLKIQNDLEYHQSGEMQSLAESVHGESKCKEILNYMQTIEEKYAHSINMEVKEAIERIKNHKEIHFEKEPRAVKITEALDMAIKSLETQEMIKEEFNRPIQDINGAVLLLCMAISYGSGGCDNCPVRIFDHDKRTEYEKCCLHEPCQTNLYNWCMEQIKGIKSIIHSNKESKAEDTKPYNEDESKYIKKCLEQGILPPLNVDSTNTKGLYNHKNGWT